MRRRFSVAAAALALSVALTVPAYAGTWKYVNDQWKYQRGTNKFAYNEWIKDNGKYYYIGNDGIMKTGWQQIDGQWYYLDQTGAMQIGWLKSDDGKWYFLYPNGAMAVNTVIDGRTIGEDGVWVPNEGDTEPANSMDLENGYLVQNLEGITKKDYTILADRYKVPYLEGLDRETLGQCLGKEYRAVAALTDKGFAKKLRELMKEP